MVDVRYFEVAVMMMDEEIREQLHAEMSGTCTDEEFLRAYEERHFEKYGYEFTI